MLAATVPSWLPEKICWALSAEYHAPLSPGGHVRIYTEEQLRDRLEEPDSRSRARTGSHALHSPYWWLRCLVGPTNDTNPLVRAYHELLVWDMVPRRHSSPGPPRRCSTRCSARAWWSTHKPGGRPGRTSATSASRAASSDEEPAAGPTIGDQHVPEAPNFLSTSTAS